MADIDRDQLICALVKADLATSTTTGCGAGPNVLALAQVHATLACAKWPS